MKLNKPVFILGCHKSGTSLVRSLLDDHPQLDFVYPNELHFFRLSGYRAEYPLGAKFHRPTNNDEFVKNALSLIEQAERGKSPFAPFDIGTASKLFHAETFRARLQDLPPLGADPERFLQYLDAVAAAFGQDLSTHHRPVRIVEKSVSNIEFAAMLKHLFPDSLFVHVIRNPYANVVAIRRARYRRGPLGKLRSFIKAIELSFDYALDNPPKIPDYYVLRYEDLVQNRHAVVRALSSRLDIRYSHSMLRPTVLGNPWGGNSTSGVSFPTGISEQPLSEWAKEITSIECKLVNRHLAELMSQWGYTPIRPCGHWILPAARERPTAYVANRLQLRPGRKRNRWRSTRLKTPQLARSDGDGAQNANNAESPREAYGLMRPDPSEPADRRQ